jgi:hypothetical protein
MNWVERIHQSARLGATQAMSTETLRAKARKLIAAANELLAIAHDLERWEGDTRAEAGLIMVENDQPAAQDSPMLAEFARSAYRDRRRRSEIFDDVSLFGEPAWDILLDLFIAAKERKRLPVTSACIGAAVPSTTALRWLTVLEEKALILREHDTTDARRIFVRLSSEGYEKMVAYFVGTSGPMHHDEAIERAALRIAR